jgi:hypothetical protein
MRQRILGGLTLAITIGLLAFGCSSKEEEESGPKCKTSTTCPYDYSTFDSTEPVSFEKDVFPLLRRSCGISTVCHGAGANQGAAGLYLGPKKSDTDTVVDAAFRQAIVDSLVGVTSLTVPGTSSDAGAAGAAGASSANDGAKLIVAGDPANSFFMLKLDGCESSMGLQCVKIKSNKTDPLIPCGESMPDGNLLCDSERDIFRRWIAQGAQNN